MSSSLQAIPLFRAVEEAFNAAKHEYDRSRQVEAFVTSLHSSGYVVVDAPEAKASVTRESYPEDDAEAA